ncbi:MAG: LamG domain-containing protein [Melioribacteraceae bacterium]
MNSILYRGFIFYCMLFYFLAPSVFSQSNHKNNNDTLTTLWFLESPFNIGGYNTTFLTDTPSVNNSSYGKALYFDGIDDGLLINFNPIADYSSFTIEVIFKPDSSKNSDNYEQRFLHIKNEDDSKRILIELRLLKNKRWSLDTFIKSDTSRCTLLDTTITHPIGDWYHVALSYSNGIMKHYVNGEEELSGKVNFSGIKDGTTSIGVRQNLKSWFCGTIKAIKFTNKALLPDKFYFIK